jgi:RNA polymerase-binding transcription factor DksA
MFETIERHARLRDILTDRRLELQQDLRRRVRSDRIGQPARAGHDVDGSAADSADEVELAMLQMEDDTLRRIDDALVRLEVNAYGTCLACGTEIPETRIRALPFVARCRTCEEKREQGRVARNRGVGFGRSSEPQKFLEENQP